MSYFGRFLAMSRPAANPRARSRFELEQHEVVEVAPSPSPAITREVTRDVQPRAPQRIEAPPATHTIERVIHVDAPPPSIERTTQVAHVERVIDRASPDIRSSPAPSRVDPPGLRRLREVMEWVSRPPADAPAHEREASPPRRDEPRARESILRPPRDRVAPASTPASTASTPSTASTASSASSIDETVVVSIGAIEVTVEAPAPPAPTSRAALTPKRALRDTRLARRLPRGG
jgi:hypothetical protein